MWSVYFALKTTISYTLYGSIKTGQLIVTSLYWLVTNCLHFLNKLLTLLTVIIEDFTVFLSDVKHGLSRIFDGITQITEQIIAGVSTTWQSLVHLLLAIYTFVSTVHTAGLNGLTAVINGFKNIFIFIKQIVVMFGEGVWFNIIYIPKSVISFMVFVISCTNDLFVQIQDHICTFIKHLHDSLLECIFNSYHFLTDVPTESFIGIVIAVCFMYVFLQFYTVLYRFFRNKIISVLQACTIKFNRLKDTLKRRLSISHETVPNTNMESDTPTSTKKFEDGSCIICQDHPKCILVLPCRHLCLCTNCTPRLMRYSGDCPICRKRIKSTMKIYT